MDVGYFRKERDAPSPGTPIIKVDYNAAGVEKGRVLMLHVRSDSLDSPRRVNIAGNSFFGSDEAFLALYKRYYETFWDWISVKDKFIGSDQFVMTETCYRYADACHPYFPGWYKMWRAMSQAVMGRAPLTGISSEYLFLDEPPASLPEVPNGHRVSYCKGKGVVLADEGECEETGDEEEDTSLAATHNEEILSSPEGEAGESSVSVSGGGSGSESDIAGEGVNNISPSGI